jgi:hypothetical protein
MPAFNLDAWVARSGALDLSAVAREDVPRHPVRPETIRTLRFMQDIESHPILAELLDRVIVDESRHFFFYFQQAETRLQNPTAARVARLLMDRFCKPVGSGVQPAAELDFMARYLFAGEEGRVAIHRVDETIRRLPGFASAQLLESWMDRNIRGSSSVTGGHHGHGHH